MWVSKLELMNFRNYSSLKLDLPPCPVVLLGDNAQGKSNLLEAIYMLATTRSQRATNDRELINWEAAQGESPFARIAGEVNRERDRVRVEVALKMREAWRIPWQAAAISEMYADASPPPVSRSGPHVQKQVKVNGVARRAAEAVGQVMAVVFDSGDIELIGGTPSQRRRCLDIICSQVDRPYLRHLQHYGRVLFQRNHLLRLIQERSGDPGQLEYWDLELARSGTYIVATRSKFVAALGKAAAAVYQVLGLGAGELKLCYLPSLQIKDPLFFEDVSQLEQATQGFLQALQACRGKDIGQGATSVGPHRDDLRFLVGRVDVGTYGSRGQRRAVGIAFRLGEGEMMTEMGGESPILLMDDALSELDGPRRRHLMEATSKYTQPVLTTTDVDRIESWFLDRSVVFEVRQGSLKQLNHLD